MALSFPNTLVLGMAADNSDRMNGRRACVLERNYLMVPGMGHLREQLGEQNSLPD